MKNDPIDTAREEPLPRLPWIELILGFVGTVFAIIMWAEFMK